MGLIIHVDGGARGNPGPAGAGVVIRTDRGQLVHEGGYFLGRQTNNSAEYHAVIHALERAQRCPGEPITLFSDSELLVRQLTGEYRVKSSRLATLHRQVQVLLLKVSRWSIRHIRREQNLRADELANLAMDRQQNVLVFDAEAGPTVGAPPAEPQPATSEKGIEPAERGESVLLSPQPPSAPQAGAPTAAAAEHAAICVTVARPPRAGACPAGGAVATAFTINSTLPAGLCVHAAHAILPTLLAMMNTEPEEFAAVPTLTVRCGHPGCDAVFQLSPTSDSARVSEPRAPASD